MVAGTEQMLLLQNLRMKMSPSSLSATATIRIFITLHEKPMIFLAITSKAVLPSTKRAISLIMSHRPLFIFIPVGRKKQKIIFPASTGVFESFMLFTSHLFTEGVLIFVTPDDFSIDNTGNTCPHRHCGYYWRVRKAKKTRCKLSRALPFS